MILAALSATLNRLPVDPQLVTVTDAQRILVVNIFLVLLIIGFFSTIVLLLARHSTRQRVEAARLAAMGTATGRLLHQVKNPLQTILLHAELLADESMISDGEARREICQAIVVEAARMADILGRLSTFASGLGQQLISEPVSLPDVVHGALRRISGECEAAGITIVADPVEDITTSGDGAFLVRALEHLLRNAYEALIEGARDGGDPRLVVSLRRRGAGAVIEVRDNGPGIAPEEQEDLFEPFVTRKGSGLGLGLPMAREIVEGHGGHIEIVSKPGQGTTAAMVLPIRAAAALAERPA